MKSKSIFRSKTFWFNVLSLGLTTLADLPIDPVYMGVITAVGNMFLRMTTKQPVHLMDFK